MNNAQKHVVYSTRESLSLSSLCQSFVYLYSDQRERGREKMRKL